MGILPPRQTLRHGRIRAKAYLFLALALAFTAIPTNGESTDADAERIRKDATEDYLPVRRSSVRDSGDSMASEDDRENARDRRHGGKRDRYAFGLSIGQNFGLSDPSGGGGGGEDRGGSLATQKGKRNRRTDRGAAGESVASIPDESPNGGSDSGPDFGGFTGGGDYDDGPGGGGGGGGGGGRGGRGLSPGTTLGASAGYLFSSSTNGSFSANHMIPNGDPERNQFQRGQSTTIRGAVGYRPIRPLSLNFSLSHRFEYETSDDSEGFGNSDTPPGEPARGGSGRERPNTTAQARSRYQLNRVFSASLNLGYAFTAGFLDPAASLAARYTFLRRRNESLSGNASLRATLPASPRSQRDGKITTLTFSAGPTYRNRDVTVRAQGFFSGSLYRPDSDGEEFEEGEEEEFSSRSAVATATEPGSTTELAQGDGISSSESERGSRARELVSSGGTASLSYRLIDDIAASTAYGLSASFKEDETTGYRSQYTVLALSYVPGQFTITGSFTLISGQREAEELEFPSKPFIGLSLQYVFGNRAALRGAGRGAAGGGGGRD